MAVNSAINITRNTFESMFEGAIFIRPPEAKDASDISLPVMGNENDMPETGFNRFRQNSGFLVQNLTTGEATAQYNDWGIYSETELARRFGAKAGVVRYQPYVGQSIIPGSVVVKLVDAATQTALAAARSPWVKMGTATTSRDSASGLFIFTTLPAGSYACEGGATGYGNATVAVTAIAGDISTTTLSLTATAEVEGQSPLEGEREGEPNAEGEAPDPEGDAQEGEPEGTVEGDEAVTPGVRRGCF